MLAIHFSSSLYPPLPVVNSRMCLPFPLEGTKWTKGVPVEVIPMAHVPILQQLQGMGAVANLRMAQSKAGPCVTGAAPRQQPREGTM